LPKDPIQVIVYIELQQRPRCLNTNKKFRNTKKQTLIVCMSFIGICK
jgi:hypothetical protein